MRSLAWDGRVMLAVALERYDGPSSSKNSAGHHVHEHGNAGRAPRINQPRPCS